MDNGNEWERNAKLMYQAGKLCVNGDRAVQDLNNLLQDFVQNSKWRDRFSPLGQFTVRDDVVSLCLVSTGMSGPEWVKWFSDHKVANKALSRLLLSPEFRFTSGVRHEIRILNPKDVAESSRYTSILVARGVSLGLRPLSLEAFCLLFKVASEVPALAMGEDHFRRIGVQLTGGQGSLNASIGRPGSTSVVIHETRDLPWSYKHGFAMELPVSF